MIDLEKRNQALALWEALYAADMALLEAENPDTVSGADYAELNAKALAAQKAYDEFPKLMTNNDESEVIFCGKSGVPLWETDEVLEDTHTGEMVLRSAIPLPERSETDASVEEAA